jgi:hypothetical protein
MGREDFAEEQHEQHEQHEHQKTSFDRSFDRSFDGSYVRWYRIGTVLTFAVIRGALRYTYRPLVIGLVVAGVWRLVEGGSGSVRPEVFALLGATIPVLAIPIFVVLERLTLTIDGEELDRVLNDGIKESEQLGRAIKKAIAGLGIGIQMLVSESICIYAVAISATSRLFCILVTSGVLAQIVWLISFTFGEALAPKRVTSDKTASQKDDSEPDN